MKSKYLVLPIIFIFSLNCSPNGSDLKKLNVVIEKVWCDGSPVIYADVNVFNKSSVSFACIGGSGVITDVDGRTRSISWASGSLSNHQPLVANGSTAGEWMFEGGGYYFRSINRPDQVALKIEWGRAVGQESGEDGLIKIN